MKQEEFDRHEWRAGCKVIYRRDTFAVMFCNFRERLVGLRHPEMDDQPFWVRCENVELANRGDAN